MANAGAQVSISLHNEIAPNGRCGSEVPNQPALATLLVSSWQLFNYLIYLSGGHYRYF